MSKNERRDYNHKLTRVEFSRKHQGIRVGEQAITIGDIVRVTDGESSGDLSAIVTDVTHDSRKAGKGSLFVAVRGELFDAHKFIPQVMQQGAVGILSELARPTD